MKDITVKVDDFGFYLVFWVKTQQLDPRDTPVARDLGEFYSDSTLTIKLLVYAEGSTTYALLGQCEKDANVDLSTGKCQYPVASGDFDTTGTYLAALVMYKGTWGSETYHEETETFRIRVIEDAPITAP
jgi:hypothetical protein